MARQVRWIPISVGNTSKYDGFYHKSKLEASSAKLLAKMLADGEITEWEREHKLIINFYDQDGKVVGYIDHHVDFRAVKVDGSILLVEAKGLKSQDYKTLHQVIVSAYLSIHLDTDYEVWYDGHYKSSWARRKWG